MHKSTSACLLSFLLLTTGCTESKAPVDTSPTELGAISENPSDAELSVTSEEALQFAQDWVRAIDKRDIAAGQKLISMDDIISRALAPLSLSDSQADQFRSGLVAANLTPSLMNQLKMVAEGGGSYELVKTVVRGNEQHAIFRFLQADEALNYHDLRIVKKSGRLQADQIFIAISGENFSDTLRNLLGPLASANGSFMSKMSGQTAQVMTNAKSQQAMVAAARNGQFDQALEHYDAMSEEARNTKPIQLQRLNILMNQGSDDEYLKAIEDYTKRFPNDPSLAMVSLDAAVLKEDPALLTKAYNDLKNWTGGDPFLGMMTSSLLIQLGDKKSAKTVYDECIVQELPNAATVDFALSAAMSLEDFTSTLQHLRVLRDQYGYEFMDLRNAGGFEGFVTSPQFNTWQAEHTARLNP